MPPIHSLYLAQQELQCQEKQQFSNLCLLSFCLPTHGSLEQRRFSLHNDSRESVSHQAWLFLKARAQDLQIFHQFYISELRIEVLFLPFETIRLALIFYIFLSCSQLSCTLTFYQKIDKIKTQYENKPTIASCL